MCRICGDNVSKYRTRSMMFLCNSCHKTTPSKVTRSYFDNVYWKGEAKTVPFNIKKEFYSDYLTSTLTLKDYILETTTQG